jgi:flagellar M-ring protein FliF
MVRKTRLPAGSIRKFSVAVLLDQDLTWQKDKDGYQRVLAAPSPEKLKVIHDLVAGVTGFNGERGDQIVIESLPFENTLSAEPPSTGGAPRPGTAPSPAPSHWMPQWNRTSMLIAGGAAGLGLVLLALLARRRRHPQYRPAVQTPVELPPGDETSSHDSPDAAAGRELESKLAERDALQQKLENQALKALKVAPVITKTSEVMAKHLREKIKSDPEVSSQVLRTWIREEES